VSSVTDNIVTFQNTTGKLVKDSGVSISALIRANGSVPFAANQSMGNHKLTNLITPTVSSDAATKGYVDGLVGSSITADGITLQLVSTVMSVRANGIANANFRQSVAASLVGRAANSTGDVADIPINADETIVRSGGVLVSAKISAINIAAAAAIALTQLAPGAGLSLVGRSASSSGSRADIVAASDHQVMRRSGATIGFGAIDLSQAAAVTGQLALANVASGTACSIVGRAANSTGALGLISVAADGDVVMRTASVVTSGKIANANVDAAAAIAGTKIAPDFGAQNVLTTGYFGGVDNPAIGGTGSALTVRAGDATGPSGTRTGGALVVRSGTGSNGAGDVSVQRGSSTVFSANVSSTFIDNPSTITLRISGSTTHTIGASALNAFVRDYLWNDTVVTPRLLQQTTAASVGQLLTISAQESTAVAGTGGAMLIQAGDATGASGTRIGGALMLRSGTGANGPGNAQLLAGTKNVINYGVTAANTFAVGDSLSSLILDGGPSAPTNAIRLRVAGTDVLNVGTDVTILVPTLQWNPNVVNPTIKPNVDISATATGKLFTVSGQDCSGTTAVTAGALLVRAGDATGASGTRTGGALDVRPGAGANAGGLGRLLTGGGTARFAWNDTGIGFGVAPVAKPTVTGSRGGNAALASALTALASLGLLTDSSS
jgi:hypothetical protein